jgi:LuxR family maltose regulon positive regulatory protein
MFDDVGRSAAAARRALELAGDQPAENSWAGSALGQALYLSGQAAEARPRLEDLVSQVPASVQPYAVVTALAVLSLITADQDDPAAASLAREAVATAEAQAVNFEPLSGIVYLALGRALACQGELAEAEVQLGRALELFEVDSMLVQAEEALDSRPGRPVQVATPLTERELAILRLLPTRLSTREIGRELYVSPNTVRSHVQAIYRKLQVNSRAEAVTKARQLGLLPTA